jgi:endonuclease-3
MIGSMIINRIIDYLERLIPEAKIELNYNKDYELLLAVMMSAQTTDIRVNQVTDVLFKRYPDLDSLSLANIEDLERIIKPIGTFRKKAKNIKEISVRLKDIGKIPNDRDFLESLPGVGRKTANVFLSNIYKEPCLAVDTHVMRVAKRLNLAQKNDSPLQIEQKLTTLFKNKNILKLHHRLVLFGRHHCKSIKPKCDSCELQDICGYYQQKTL